ncbi:MAG: YidH family protein [Kiritimatiellia bacterium]
MTAYQRFKSEDLILRDELAIDRTLLANERTLLAYLRSGVALMLAGVTLFHFSAAKWFQVIGLSCIPAGVIVMLIGTLRYRQMNSRILTARNQSNADKSGK